MAETIEVLLRIRDEATKAVNNLNKGLAATKDTVGRLDDGGSFDRIEDAAKRAAGGAYDLDADLRSIKETSEQIGTQGLDGLGDSADRASADVRELEDEIEDVERASKQAGNGSFNRLRRSVKNTEREVEQLSRGFRRFQGGLTQLQSLAVAGIGFEVIRRSISATIGVAAAFEEQLVAVGKTSNIQGQALDQLGESIAALSKRIPVAKQELFGIAESAGQLGVQGSENILAFTETIAKLTRTTNLGGQDAATAIARVFNITGEAISEVDRFGSVLVGLGNNFAATESEITHMTTNLAQAIGVFGVSSTELAALGATLQATGQRAERSRTALQRLFQTAQQAAQNGTPELAEFARIAGVTGEEFSRAFEEDALGAIRLFLSGLKDVTEQGETFSGVLSGIGINSNEAIAVLQTLAANNEDLSRAINLANEAQQEGNALNDEFAQFASTTNARLTTLGSTISDAGRRVGTELLPTVNQLILDLETLISTGEGLSVFQRLGGAIAKTIEYLRIGFNSVSIAINSVTATFRLARLSMLEGIALIADGLSAITFGSLSDGFAEAAAKVREQSMATAQAIKEDFDDIDAAQESQIAAMGRIADVWERQAQAAKESGDKTEAAARKAQKAFEEVRSSFETETGQALAKLATDARVTAEEFSTAFEKALSSAGTTREVDEIKAALKLTGEQSILTGEQIATALGQADEAAVKLQNSLENGGERAAQSVEKAFERLGLQSTQALQKAEDEALSAFEVIATSGNQSARQVLAAFEASLNDVSSLEGLERLRDQLADAPVDGIKNLGRYNELLKEANAQIDEANEKQEELANGADAAAEAVEAAFEQLGVQSTKAMQEAEDATLKAFGTIAESGEQSARAVLQAYESSLNEVSTLEGLEQLREQLTNAPAAGIRNLERYHGLLDQTDEQIARAREEQSRFVAETDKAAAAQSRVADSARDTSAAVAESADRFEQARAGAKRLAGGIAGIIGQVRSGLLEDFGEKAVSAFDSANRAAARGDRTIQGYIQGLAHAANRTRQLAQIEKDRATRLESALKGRLSSATSQLTDRFGRLNRAITTSGGSTYELALSAQRAIRSFDYLDQSRLSGLQSSIDRVLSRVRDLRQEAGSTVRELRDELAQLEGDYVSIEQRRTAARRQDLQAKLQQARNIGDSQSIDQYQTAISLLNRVGRRRVAEARDRVRQEQEARRREQQPQPQPVENSPAPKRVIELRGPSGDSADVEVENDQRAEELLKVLEDAGFSAS